MKHVCYSWTRTFTTEHCFVLNGSGEPDYEVSYAPELTKANMLLRVTGVNSKPMGTVDELRKCASSMFVAVIESMVNRRIAHIVRAPKRRSDYVRNAQSVIDILNVVLRSDLQVCPSVLCSFPISFLCSTEVIVCPKVQ